VKHANVKETKTKVKQANVKETNREEASAKEPDSQDGKHGRQKAGLRRLAPGGPKASRLQAGPRQDPGSPAQAPGKTRSASMPAQAFS
jgi:hypothetical protein